ncbi:ester cyclase [Halobacteria archaeon AArc-curdl1]|uniref:Ester cyclase n=1 Tax=Natronosalvus hydrolyticus TaxID=2979988 RepID=A0AAP3E5V4_9EURY|nr:ester cyclase [Halobacteria archaeon AArc-curdl1]
MAATAANRQSLELVRRFTQDVFNDRQYDRIGDFQAEDYVQHGPMAGMELHGSDAALETMKMFHAAFSDLRASEELAFSDDAGEYVCTAYTYRGTHDGEFMGISPTDVTADVRGMSIHRLEDGKIAEGWLHADFLSLLQQVGVVPAMDDIGA